MKAAVEAGAEAAGRSLDGFQTYALANLLMLEKGETLESERVVAECGPAIMATDSCINLGLTLPDLSEETARELKSFLPAEASIANPVDMIASATPDTYSRTLATVLDDDAIDMAIVINVTPLLSNPIDIMDAIAKVAERYAKPVLAVMMATEDFYEQMKTRVDHPPVYRFPESAARALSKLSRYADWRRRPTNRRPSSRSTTRPWRESSTRPARATLPMRWRSGCCATTASRSSPDGRSRPPGR